jgi:hypothetical protein
MSGQLDKKQCTQHPITSRQHGTLYQILMPETAKT